MMMPSRTPSEWFVPNGQRHDYLGVSAALADAFFSGVSRSEAAFSIPTSREHFAYPAGRLKPAPGTQFCDPS